MDLRTQLCGNLVLDNPLLPGSGPMSGDAERMMFLVEQGIGGIVTKTIAPEAAKVTRPCIAGNNRFIFNSEAWSEYSGETWYNDFLPKLMEKYPETTVIASVGYDDEDLNQLIPKLEEYVVGYEYIPRYVGKQFDEVTRIVKVLRNLTEKPIWVKMNGNISDPVGFADACKEGGADGIVAITSYGPNMVIDLEKRRPVIGIPGGYVWTSGPAIKPLALADVHLIKQAHPEMSVIASGGCTSAEDVLEFLLAGADAVQILSAAFLKGKTIYSKILAQLPVVLEKYGFASIEDVKRTGLGEPPGATEPSYPIISREKCTKCGKCANNCPYFAMTMEDDGPVCNEEVCFGCGLCQTQCPVSAIKNVIE